MNQVVFLEPNRLDAVPFTTSDVIAECAEVNYRSVQRLIDKYQNELEAFGRVRFEITPFETKGGIQNKKIYRLNEEQATFLITLLKNTPPVVAFKKELVRQFYAMRTELQKRQIEREALRPVRRSLTDAIQATGGDTWAYKNYTDLAYKSVTGQNAAQLRKTRGADKTATAVEYMTAEEIQQVTKRQEQFAVLVEMGMEYQQIKEIVNQRIGLH